ncbi:MAG TPA: U32 family peptidase [Bacteroidota bacterium]|nr:U32 family peptidase [Bacteroidota bacterium]
MSQHSTAIELLAPARNLEGGLAAINYGADAVYIGAPRFGARAAAGNSLEDIAALISYAHKYWAKVYVTLNTVLYDHELEEARKLAHQLYERGADALIIQDMGLLELDLPPIPLFASTQTNNVDVAKIQFLEKVGLQRVILARELSLRQIQEIRKSTSVDLEFFVHGSLCVSFSGICYFSQAAQGRSANRGECAQMCRLPYTLTDARGNILAQNQHVLSLKDLDLSGYLAELIDAGISSFKIEGRLKETSYVKNVTAFYRSKLDALLEGDNALRRASSGKTIFHFEPDPERTFSRGKTDYFIRGRRPGIASLHTPKSVGKLIGTVMSVDTTSFVLDGHADLHNGDGICFFNTNDEFTGININGVEGTRVTPNSMRGIEPGTVLYRNLDLEFTKALKSDSSRRAIAVKFVFGETAAGFQLRATDEDGVEVIQTLEHPKEPARKSENAKSSILTQLSKLGETIFVSEEITIQTDPMFFLPVGVLNKLRRDCISALEAERERMRHRPTFALSANTEPFPSRQLDYTANVVNRMAAQFYRRHGVQEIEPGVELQSDAAGKALMTTKHCLKYQFDLCRGERGSAEELYLFDGRTNYRLEFDCDQCVMRVVSP